MIEAKTIGWAEFVKREPDPTMSHKKLIAWKLERFKEVDWGGASFKWGATGNAELPLDDGRVPLGCVSLVGDELAGVAFIIDDDLANYPVHGGITEPFVADQQVFGECANPWFAGHLVDERYRRSGLGRQQEKWLIGHAALCADLGRWPYPRRRLWSFTERQPLAWLPEMYQRSGWQVHRTFQYQGLQRWVLYFDF